jgi:hypothetical protein
MRRTRINDNAAKVKRRSTGKPICFKHVGQTLFRDRVARAPRVKL